MIHGVIFDVDGVLLDSMKIWDSAAAQYLAQHGIAAQPDLKDVMFSMTLEEGGHFLKKNYPLTASETEITAGVLEIVHIYYETTVSLKRGVLPLLTALQTHGIPMIAATTSEKSYLNAAFERLHILPFFRDILTCSEIGAGKDKPVIFHRCCESLGTVPAETLVFEDSLYAAETAKAAGFVTVGMYDASSAHRQKALQAVSDFYFLTMEQALSKLLPLLKQQEGLA